MKDNKDIHPLDKLFRQSLEGFSPDPPASVWKGIRSKLFRRKWTPGKGFTSPGGLAVISGIILVAASWILYKSFIAEPQATSQNRPAQTTILNSAASPDNNAGQIQTPGKLPATNLNRNRVPGENSLTIYPKDSSTAKQKSNRAAQTWGPKSLKPLRLKERIAISEAKSVQQNTSLPKTAPQYIQGTTQEADVNGISVATKPASGKVTEPDGKVGQISEANLAQEPDKIDPANPGSGNTGTAPAKIRKTEPVQDENIGNKDSKLPVQPPSLSKNDSGGDGMIPLVVDKPQPGTAAGSDILPGKTKPAMPSNLEWQLSANGHMGQVIQKQRNSNTFYGCAFTGGLWNTRLKGGVETGFGISKFKDYGQVENSRMQADTIIQHDTIWHTQDSTQYYEIIDSLVISRNRLSDTVKYSYGYTYLQIPVFFTKQIARYGKLSIDIKAGPVIGFLISEKESISHTSMPLTGDLTVTDNNYTRLDVSLQLHLAPQLRWDVTDKLSMVISPACVLFVNNLYDKKKRPATKPYGIEIYGGLTYELH
ncbi:MAG: outer membrane beta-barrel protein [Bacteroidota bacterium]